jgi:AcrR family transcriptional regulator
MGKKVTAAPVRRNATVTRDRVLKAAIAEFCRYGFDGARTDRVAKRASVNIRMIYHYFGSKERLYLAALEQVYREVRTREAALNLRDHEPAKGMRALVDFTFRHLIEHPEFIELIRNENLLRGKYLKKSRSVPETAMPLVSALHDLLTRGVRQGVFRRNVDPVQLYVSILSLCFIHLSNRYTLSIMFSMDLSDQEWLDERLKHVQAIIASFLAADAPRSNAKATGTRRTPKA